MEPKKSVKRIVTMVDDGAMIAITQERNQERPSSSKRIFVRKDFALIPMLMDGIEEGPTAAKRSKDMPSITAIQDKNEEGPTASKRPKEEILPPDPIPQQPRLSPIMMASQLPQIQAQEFHPRIRKQPIRSSNPAKLFHGKLKERCRFWPNCDLPDKSCKYVHPVEPCSKFPDCQYGDKCLYTHPKCKFNERCANQGCLYAHIAKVKPAAPQPPQQPVRPQQPCANFPNCQFGSKCAYSHPRCKFGERCANSECPYSHAIRSKPKHIPVNYVAPMPVEKNPQPCANFPNCTFGDKCRYTHPKCKFNKRCGNQACPYSHTVRSQAGYNGPNTTMVPSFMPPNPHPPPHHPIQVIPRQPVAPMPKDPAATLCKFAAKCRNENCPYKHPPKCRYWPNCLQEKCTFWHPVDPNRFRWVAQQPAELMEAPDDHEASKVIDPVDE